MSVLAASTAGLSLPRMNTQRHPRYPRMPSILPIALASKPPNAPASVVDEKKKLYRFCDSARLYHLRASEDIRTGWRHAFKCPPLTSTVGRNIRGTSHFRTALIALREDVRTRRCPERTKEEACSNDATVILCQALQGRRKAEHEHATGY